MVQAPHAYYPNFIPINSTLLVLSTELNLNSRQNTAVNFTQHDTPQLTAQYKHNKHCILTPLPRRDLAARRTH